jgi:hypothetical protein
MVKFDRCVALSAFGVLLAVLCLPAPAASAAAVSPFCVLRGSTDGPGGSPQLCAYTDYQACLQAAADLRGNCVQNIDYHGEAATAPARTRRRR